MKFRRVLILLRQEFRLYIRLFRDRRTPMISKILMILTLVYLISPIDIIPDFIPFAGWVDEIIIIPLLFYIATLFIPKDVIEENRQIAKKGLKGKFRNAEEGVIVE